MARIKVRKGTPSVALGKVEFAKRIRQRFYDPVFDPLQTDIDKIIDAAVARAERRQKSAASKSRILFDQWAAAHGVMIVTPVHWYQAPTVLKSMIDRLVCADGGNPDPCSTSGKDPQKAKDIEMKGWAYPATWPTALSRKRRATQRRPWCKPSSSCAEGAWSSQIHT